MKTKPRFSLLKMITTFVFFPQNCILMTSLVRFLSNYYLRSVCQSSPPWPDLSGQDPAKLPEGHWRNSKLECSSFIVIISAVESMPWDHPWSSPFALTGDCVSSSMKKASRIFSETPGTVPINSCSRSSKRSSILGQRPYTVRYRRWSLHSSEVNSRSLHSHHRNHGHISRMPSARNTSFTCGRLEFQMAATTT